MNMDRRKLEIKNSYNSFVEECNFITQLLNKIQQKQNELMNSVNALNSEEFVSNSKYVLNVKVFQHLALQKILEINFDLEKFVAANIDVQNLDACSSFNESMCSVSNKIEEVSVIQKEVHNKNCKKEFSSSPEWESSSDFVTTDQSDCSTEVCSEVNKTPEKIVLKHSVESFVLNPEENLKTEQDNVSELSFISYFKPDELCSNSTDFTVNASEMTETCPKVPELIDKIQKYKVAKSFVKSKLVSLKTPDLSFKPSSNKSELNTSITATKKKKSKVSKEKNSEYELKPNLEIKSFIPEINTFCIISNVVDPSHFYIQIVNNNIHEFNLLSTKLQNKYAACLSSFNTKDEAVAVIKDVCVVFSVLFGAWFRAQIVDWKMEDETEVTVKLIDYGDIFNESYKNLQEIDDYLKEFPAFAIKCHLDSLYPPGSTEENILTCWPTHITEEFRNIVAYKTYQLIFLIKTTDSLGVELLELTSKELLGEILLKKNYSAEIFLQRKTYVTNPMMINQIKTAQGSFGLTSDMSSEEKLDMFFKNVPDKIAGTINEALLNYDLKDEIRMCPFVKPNGTCFKGHRCKLNHDISNKNKIIKEVIPIFSAAKNELELPVPGQEIILYITYIKAANHFRANMVRVQPYGTCLEKLIDEMNCNNVIKTYKACTCTPAVGQIVIAKHWNGNWYRAKVISFLETSESQNTFELFMVDLGENCSLELSDIREITEHFLELPFQVINCYLKDVCPVKEKESVAIDYLERKYLCDTLKAKVVNVNNEAIQVIIYNEYNRSIGQEVINKGYGTELKTSYFPNYKEAILVD